VVAGKGRGAQAAGAEDAESDMELEDDGEEDGEGSDGSDAGSEAEAEDGEAMQDDTRQDAAAITASAGGLLIPGSEDFIQAGESTALLCVKEIDRAVV
jgi:hypothetical protein